MRFFAWLPIIAVSMVAAPLPAQEPKAADEVVLPHGCTMSSQSKWIRTVHCATALTDAEYAEVGKASCRERVPCGTWFWTRAEDMPAEAPENHDGLTQAQVTSAVGVWVAEDSNLIRITKD